MLRPSDHLKEEFACRPIMAAHPPNSLPHSFSNEQCAVPFFPPAGRTCVPRPRASALFNDVVKQLPRLNVLHHHKDIPRCLTSLLLPAASYREPLTSSPSRPVSKGLCTMRMRLPVGRTCAPRPRAGAPSRRCSQTAPRLDVLHHHKDVPGGLDDLVQADDVGVHERGAGS